MGFANPVVIGQGDAPGNGDVPVFNSATGQWDAAAPIETIDVPQAGIGPWAALSAATAATVATADATAAGVGYLQATAATWVTLANALKVELNKVIADNAALHAELAQLRLDHNSLLSELEDAAILAAP